MHLDDKIDDSTGNKQKPEIITYYNQTKIGVDIVDKMCSSYSVARNTKRWGQWYYSFHYSIFRELTATFYISAMEIKQSGEEYF